MGQPSFFYLQDANITFLTSKHINPMITAKYQQFLSRNVWSLIKIIDNNLNLWSNSPML